MCCCGSERGRLGFLGRFWRARKLHFVENGHRAASLVSETTCSLIIERNAVFFHALCAPKILVDARLESLSLFGRFFSISQRVIFGAVVLSSGRSDGAAGRKLDGSGTTERIVSWKTVQGLILLVQLDKLL